MYAFDFDEHYEEQTRDKKFQVLFDEKDFPSRSDRNAASSVSCKGCIRNQHLADSASGAATLAPNEPSDLRPVWFDASDADHLHYFVELPSYTITLFDGCNSRYTTRDDQGLQLSVPAEWISDDRKKELLDAPRQPRKRKQYAKLRAAMRDDCDDDSD